MPLHHYLPLAPNVQILLLLQIDVEEVIDGCIFLRFA